MAKRVDYFVQSFEQKRKSLVEGQRDVMWTAQDAVNRALVQSLRFAGVVAVMVTTEPETNTVSDVSVLKQFGEIPENYLAGVYDVGVRNKPVAVQTASTIRTR